MIYLIERATVVDLAEAIAIDDDACALFASAGIDVSMSSTHPFSVAEQARFRRSAELGRLFFAREETGARVGMAVLDRFDGHGYLDQLSVKQSAMRRGVGRFLLDHAARWAAEHGETELWLTTYDHLPWNRPYYESYGFVLVSEDECGPGIREHLAEQRRHLPEPNQRVAMRKRIGV